MFNNSVKGFFNFRAGRYLWGKKSSRGDICWLPLIMHLSDTVEVGKRLWDEWLCDGAKRNIKDHCAFNAEIETDEMRLQAVRGLFAFLCAAHDLGKATPVFQRKKARVDYAGLQDQDERNERQSRGCDVDRAIELMHEEASLFYPKEMKEALDTPHALCSQVILLEKGGPSVFQVAAILGAHHGKPQKASVKASFMEAYSANFYGGREGKACWTSVQDELYEWSLSEGGFESASDLPVPDLIASTQLSGLLVMADWISSNEWLFPYISVSAPIDISACVGRAERGLKKLALTHRWEPLADLNYADPCSEYYDRRFGFSVPNALQLKMVEIARGQEQSGLIVVEAPMGYGKTETALAAAEILAKKSGRTGVFFALPTQATSNGIFPRLLSWIRHFDDSSCHSVELFHSRAVFNEDWEELRDEEARRIDSMVKCAGSNGDSEDADPDDDTLIVNDWFSGRKKSMLADFVVGTIDQLLMGAFKHKHLMLRHLGLVNKIVIIDECHAYDAYMSVYLERILEWLGKYHVPTIVLSATLPSDKRVSLMNAYRGEMKKDDRNLASLIFDCDLNEEGPDPAWMTTREYPVITYGDCEHVGFEVIPRDSKLQSVALSRMNDEAVADDLEKMLENGGCAGIIVNSVTRAQTFYKTMVSRFGHDRVLLFHSRFLMPDRSEIERLITKMLGKPGKDTERPKCQIVIGTQVLEQSLDIDFDILYTDIAPMDLLIQRMGRLHRHERPRPDKLSSPMCRILGVLEANTFNRASVAVYGNYLLMRTLALLPETLTLPDDISQLVDDVYNDNCKIAGLDNEQYNKAVKQYQSVIQNKEGRAKAFRLGSANVGKRSSINGWLDCDGGDKLERVAVRDIQESIEVILVQELDDGYIHLMDEAHKPVSGNETPSDALAREILRYSLELPIGVIGQFDDTIAILENCTEELALWQKSRWLKGSLFIILDRNGQFNRLPGFVINYSSTEGLSYRKEEQTNA